MDTVLEDIRDAVSSESGVPAGSAKPLNCITSQRIQGEIIP